MPGDSAPGARQAQTVRRTVCVRARSPAIGLRPLAPPLLTVKGTRRPRQATELVFDGRIPGRWQAKVGGHPPTEVEEEGRAQPGPGERARTQTVLRTVCAWRAPGALSPGMEWEGARRPWHAGRSNARRSEEPTSATGRNGPGTSTLSVSGRPTRRPVSAQRPRAGPPIIPAPPSPSHRRRPARRPPTVTSARSPAARTPPARARNPAPRAPRSSTPGRTAPPAGCRRRRR